MTRPVAALIGSEYEENLSLRYLVAAIEAAGGTAAIIAHNEAGDGDLAIDAVLALGPTAVGLSVPFQYRAPELLRLATSLREREIGRTHLRGRPLRDVRVREHPP